MAEMSQHIMEEVALAIERFEEGDGDAFLVGSLQELCTWLCVGGESFVRSLNVRLCTSQLIFLLDHAFSAEVRILACRALATTVDVVPRAAQMISLGVVGVGGGSGRSASAAAAVGDGDAPLQTSSALGNNGIDVIVNALRDDVYLLQHEIFAEELLKCLSVLTIDAHGALLQSNAHGALVTLLPVLPEQQRVLGLTCVSNLFSSIGPSDWESVEPAAVVLQNVFMSKIADVHRALGLQQQQSSAAGNGATTTPPSSTSPSATSPGAHHRDGSTPHHHHHHSPVRITATDEKLLIAFLQAFAHLMDRIALGSSMGEDADAKFTGGRSTQARGNSAKVSERSRVLSLVEDMFASLGLLIECSEIMLSRSGGGLGGADGGGGAGGGALGGGGGSSVNRNVVPNGLHIRNGVFSILTCFHNAAPRHFLDAIIKHGIIEVLTAATLRALTDNVSSLNPESMIASAALSPQFSSALSGSGAAGGGRSQVPTEHQHSLTLHTKQQTLLGQDYSLSGFLEFFLFLLPVAHVTVDEFSLVQPQHLWMWGDEFHNRNEYDEIVSRRLEKEYQTQRRRVGFTPVDLPMTSGGGGRGVNFQQLRHVARDGSLARPIFRHGILHGFYHRKAQAMSQLCCCPLGQWALDGSDEDAEEHIHGEGNRRRTNHARAQPAHHQQRDRSSSSRGLPAIGAAPSHASSTASSRRRVLQPVDDDDEEDGGSSCSCCVSLSSYFRRRRGGNEDENESNTRRRRGSEHNGDQAALSSQANQRRLSVAAGGGGAAAQSGVEAIDPDVITLHVASSSPQRRRGAESPPPQHQSASSAVHNRLPGSADAHVDVELFPQHHDHHDDPRHHQQHSDNDAVVQLQDVAELNSLAPALRRMMLQHAGLSRRVVLYLIPTILTVCKSTVNAVVLRYCTALLLRTIQFLSPSTTTVVAEASLSSDELSSTLPAAHYQTLQSIAAPYIGDVVEVLSGILRVASRGDLAQQVAIPLTLHSRDWERVFGPQPSSPVGSGGTMLRSAHTSYLMSVKGEMFCMASAALASLCKLAAVSPAWSGPTQRRVREVVRQHHVLGLLSVASAQLYSAAAMTATNDASYQTGGGGSGSATAATSNAYAHFRCPCHSTLPYVLEEAASYAAEAMHVLSVDVLGGCSAASPSPLLSPVLPNNSAFLEFNTASDSVIPKFLLPATSGKNATRFVVEAETSRSAHMRHPREDSEDDSTAETGSGDGSTFHHRSVGGGCGAGDGVSSISSSVAAPQKPTDIAAAAAATDAQHQSSEQPAEQQRSPASTSIEGMGTSAGPQQRPPDDLDFTLRSAMESPVKAEPQSSYFSSVLGPLGAPLRELADLFKFMDLQHLALSDVFLINLHYVEAVARRLRELEFRLSLMEADIDVAVNAAAQSPSATTESASSGDGYNLLLFALGVTAQGASHLQRLFTQIVRFVSTRASTSLGTMAYDAPLLLSLVSSTSSSSAGHGSNGSSGAGYQSLLSSTSASSSAARAGSVGGSISIAQSTALMCAIQERATRPVTLRVSPATPLGDLSPSVISACGPFMSFAPPTTRLRVAIGKQRLRSQSSKEMNDRSAEGGGGGGLSAEELADVVAPCVEFELSCLPYATVLQLQREIAERLNDLPLGCGAAATTAASVVSPHDTMTRTNTSVSIDATGGQADERDDVDDDDDDTTTRSSAAAATAQDAVQQQQHPPTAIAASPNSVAVDAHHASATNDDESEDTATASSAPPAEETMGARYQPSAASPRQTSGAVTTAAERTSLMSHPFTSEFDDGIPIAIPEVQLFGPSSSHHNRIGSREPILDRSASPSPNTVLPPPAATAAVPPSPAPSSPHRQSRSMITADQVLIVIDGTPIMDPGMSIMDALVAYCSTTAGPFRKLVDAFLPRTSSSSSGALGNQQQQQLQQQQQAMLQQATSRAHLQRAFSLWTATHSITFAVRQAVPSSIPTTTADASAAVPPNLGSGTTYTGGVGIPRPLAREGACCPCRAYDRAAMTWENGRYYCHPSHFYPSPHDGERWRPTTPLREKSDHDDDDDDESEDTIRMANLTEPANHVLKGVLMLGDALASILAQCAYLAGSHEMNATIVSDGAASTATTTPRAERQSPSQFPRAPSTAAAATPSTSSQGKSMGGTWSVNQAPDARCLHSALIHDIQVQLPSFAIPLVAFLSHVAARSDVPYDDALACVAFWGYPQLFPFELRRKLFTVLVGAHRLLVPKQFVPSAVLSHHQVGAEWMESVALQRIHHNGGEHHPSASTNTPMPKKVKITLPRDAVGTRGMELLREYAACPLHLDVEFDGEPGTGLGPTLEFFSLLATALATTQNVWNGIGNTEQQHAASPAMTSSSKLFPKCVTSSTAGQHDQLLRFFEDVGIFVSRILLDGHAVNFPLHPFFIRRLQCAPMMLEDLPTALASVDGTLERTLRSLEEMPADALEACDLLFVLPSDESVELQPHGRTIPITLDNVKEYCDAVRAHHLDTAVRPFVNAMHTAMRSTCVHPRLLQLFSSTEMVTMIGGPRGVLWDTEASLMASVCAAHGYHMKSRVVLDLVRTVVSWDAAKQRSFLRFVSGSDCLPVGGLHPKLTVVRRDADPDITPSRASRIRNRSITSNRDEDATPVSRDGVQVRTSIFGSPPPMAPRLEDPDSTGASGGSPIHQVSPSRTAAGGDVADTELDEGEALAFDRSAAAVLAVAEAIDASLQEPASLANASFLSTSTPTPAVIPGFSFGGLGATSSQNRNGVSAINERQELLDECLPTVNTCFHYLKLPDYSSREVLEDRLRIAIEEGQDCFLLS
ncbi:Hypothetical protein, putative [Bodo saltans]|uniref:E3 ubiquitin-protein ligase TRIP12 n=1 Tax=Bodo saltans TaxID=75058 RepID=A0A0S4JDK6_BODSA|nr:Hypothetical protein, putative [Bodo saltans]|eukprot:CUG88204.1 Hypothetical protein, putative [Bodo saltans]